jgi:hypothetical protein
VASEESNTVQRRRLFDVATQPEPAAAATTTTNIRGASVVDTNLFLAEESDEELVRALGGYGSLVRFPMDALFGYPCSIPLVFALSHTNPCIVSWQVAEEKKKKTYGKGKGKGMSKGYGVSGASLVVGRNDSPERQLTLVFACAQQKGKGKGSKGYGKGKGKGSKGYGKGKGMGSKGKGKGKGSKGYGKGKGKGGSKGVRICSRINSFVPLWSRSRLTQSSCLVPLQMMGMMGKGKGGYSDDYSSGGGSTDDGY